LEGSVGQIVDSGVDGLPGEDVVAPPPDRAWSGSVTTVSGTTVATPGSAASAAPVLAGTVAANAFSVVYWRETEPPRDRIWAISGRRSRACAAARARTLAALASRPRWRRLRTTITRRMRASRSVRDFDNPWWNRGAEATACVAPARASTATAPTASLGARCICRTSRSGPGIPRRRQPRDVTSRKMRGR
jgi:hypothetical protein